MEGVLKHRYHTPLHRSAVGPGNLCLRDSKWSWWSEGHALSGIGLGNAPPNLSCRKPSHGLRKGCIWHLPQPISWGSNQPSAIWEGPGAPWWDGGALDLTHGSAPSLPGDQAQWQHLKTGIIAAPLGGSVKLKGKVCAEVLPNKKHQTMLLTRRMCQSQQGNLRWVFRVLPLLTPSESTSRQLRRRKGAKNAENCSERRLLSGLPN